MKIKLTFCFLFFVSLGFSQIQKGDWLIRGVGLNVNRSIENSKSPYSNFNIALGYFITDQWLAGGGVGLEFTDRYTYVTNELFGRFYFKDNLSRNRAYLEASWKKGQYALIGAGLSDQRYTKLSPSLSGGMDLFLSNQLAIEMQLNYYFYTQLKSPREGNISRSEHLGLDFKLQYFFRYRDFRVERLIDYRNILSKGKWFIGGTLEIRKGNRLRFDNVQDLKPILGKFIKNNWAVGGQFIYNATASYGRFNLGIAPFSRYYLNTGRKRKLFAEMNMGYTLELNRNNDKYSKVHFLHYGGKVGLSNFINEEVSFDIAYAFSQAQGFNSFISDKALKISNSGLQLGLQFFLN